MFNLFLSFVSTRATWLNILGNTSFCENNAQGSCMGVSSRKSVGNIDANLVQHVAYVKKLVVPKYAKFSKYTKPKIFMLTTSTK